MPFPARRRPAVSASTPTSSSSKGRSQYGQKRALLADLEGTTAPTGECSRIETAWEVGL